MTTPRNVRLTTRGASGAPRVTFGKEGTLGDKSASTGRPGRGRPFTAGGGRNGRRAGGCGRAPQFAGEQADVGDWEGEVGACGVVGGDSRTGRAGLQPCRGCPCACCRGLGPAEPAVWALP